MKTLLATLLISSISFSGFAQKDTTSIKIFNKKIVEVTEANDQTKVEVGKNHVKVSESPNSDTVQVRIGNHNIEIISDNDNNNTRIDVEKINNFNSKWDEQNQDKEINVTTRYKKKFNGHWASLEFGGNQLLNTNYDLYLEGTPDFLDTKPEKSFEINLNFVEYNFGFGSYAGIVTGLGLNFNDYKFKNRYTITIDDDEIVQPQELEEGDFRKSKLSTIYLTAPLLFEVQVPGNNGHDRMFIAAGVIGGLKIGDHTKTKVGSNKSKDRGNHSVAPFRWGYTAKIGFEDVGIYATYYETTLFEKDKGPSTNPFSIGLTFSF